MCRGLDTVDSEAVTLNEENKPQAFDLAEEESQDALKIPCSACGLPHVL